MVFLQYGFSANIKSSIKCAAEFGDSEIRGQKGDCGESFLKALRFDKLRDEESVAIQLGL